MTRINCIPVEELSTPHLVAEYRELPRVFSLAQRAWERGRYSQPDAYTLGKGHILFFYTRLGFLAKRHAQLINEMKRRGYKPAYSPITRDSYPAIPDALWGDWQPTLDAMRLNRQRIADRLAVAAQKKIASPTETRST